MSLTILHDLEQGTEEWATARRGIVTASTVGRLVTYGPPDAVSVACPTCEARPTQPCLSVAKGKDPKPIKSVHPARTEHAAGRAPVFDVAANETSRGLTMTLVAERLSGFTEDVPMNGDMWRGTLSEPFARDEYGRHFAPVKQVGFMVRTEADWTLGYSPDGLVGDDGLLEIKSPRAKTHVQTVLADEVPAYYMPQLQAGLLVSGRKWCDFVSYVGGMHMRPIRVYPDGDWFEAITAACKAFEQTAERLITEYREAVAGLPITERIDHNELGLVF
jgi:hypothetical protein